MKRQRGITLIALVITIIVLLILAGVSISAITGENGIVDKARDAAEKTEEAEKEEQEALKGYEDWMDSAVEDVNRISFKIEDKEYQAEEGMTWVEWIGSDYNVDGYKVIDEEGANAFWDSTEEYVVVLYEGGGHTQYNDDIIIADYQYYLYPFGMLPEDNVTSNIITFTIEGVEYQAEEGMTWDEWLSSTYNVDNYGKTEAYVIDSTEEYQICSVGDGNGMQTPEDVIVADFEYHHWVLGFGGTDWDE